MIPLSSKHRLIFLILLTVSLVSTACISQEGLETIDAPLATVQPETPSTHLPETPKPTAPPTTSPSTSLPQATVPPQTTTPSPSLSPTPEPTEPPAKNKGIELDVVYKEGKAAKPSWLIDNFDGPAPWDGSIYMAESSDGLSFTGEKLFVDHGGVPNLLLTSDNQLIATFQYFSFEHEGMFDVIAYTTSDDMGVTWTGVRKLTFEGRGFGADEIGPGGPNPVDPTLVELEDGSLRLYFTFHQPGSRYPTLFSARAKSVEETFKVEGPQLDTDKMILDPAVVYYKGLWHHFTVRHGEKTGKQYVNVHSTSPDGQSFELQDDILLDFQLLGQVIDDSGRLRFYGSGDGVQSATSSDGYEWAKDSSTRIDGADPGAAQLPDGKYLLIYTKVQPK